MTSSKRLQFLAAGSVGAACGGMAWMGLILIYDSASSIPLALESTGSLGGPLSPFVWTTAWTVVGCMLAVANRRAPWWVALAAGLLAPIVGVLLIVALALILNGEFTAVAFFGAMLFYGLLGLMVTSVVTLPAGVALSFLVHWIVNSNRGGGLPTPAVHHDVQL